MMVKYLIIDDEHIAHDIIKGYCKMLPNLEFKGDCYDAIEAIDFLNKNEIDLIFLDLNMPKLKGFEFLKILPNPPKVIVTTAYKEHALEGFELNVSDYLLKPFSFERFLKAVNNAISTPVKTQESASIPTESKSKNIFIRSNKKYTQVEIDAIQFIEASGNYTKIITTSETITIRDKVSNVIELLPKNDFLQVHKSFAVAIKHINSIEGNRIHISNDIIPIGKLYKSNINKILK